MIRRLVQAMALAVTAGVLCVAAGFAWFVAIADDTQPQPPHADGIVALTGGPERVETALHLLASDRGDRLLVSGVAPGATLTELARRAGLDPSTLADRITLGRVATTTVGNAEEAADWAQAHSLHSLIVVTAGYHMPRALLELGRTMPQVVFYPVTVQPAELTTRATARLLASEYAKLLGAWLGVSWAVPQRTRATLAHPVDKSVRG